MMLSVMGIPAIEKKSGNHLSVLFLACAALSLAVWGCPDGKEKWPVPEAARKVKNPVPLTDAGLAVARELYLDNCAQCHGEKGKGDGPDAAMYSVKPGDLTNAQRMSEMTDGEIFFKLSEGRQPMPAFKKSMSEEKRWQLVHLLRTFTAKNSDSANKPGNSLAR